MMAKAVLFISFLMLFYIYIGYPAAVCLVGKLLNRSVKKGSFEPFVSIVIAAYNEERNIGQTLRNKLELHYPGNKFEIIVVSDGSTDRTDEIVGEFAAGGVKLIRQEPRAGKTAALNKAVAEAKGEIIVFSDANSIYDGEAVSRLAANFHDPAVGYVTGKLIYANPDKSDTGESCGAYMKYENFLRLHETKAGSIVGVNGGIDAVRKELYEPMNPDQLPDFVLPLKTVERGFRVVYEPSALLKEDSLKSSSEEYRMRVRVSLRAFWALHDVKHLLTFKSNKIFCWQLWSHKVLRYLAFVFLAGLYGTNMFLWPVSIFYQMTFLFQNILYFGALLSALLERTGRESFYPYFIRYFLLLNLASAHACLKFLLRQKQVVWAPRKG